MPIYMPEIKLNKSNTYAKRIVHYEPFSAGISAVLIINAEVISPRNGEHYFSSESGHEINWFPAAHALSFG